TPTSSSLVARLAIACGDSRLAIGPLKGTARFNSVITEQPVRNSAARASRGGAMLRERALTSWKDTTASRAATSSRAARKIFSTAIGAGTGTPPVSEVKINEVQITSRLSVEAIENEIVHY